MSCLFCGGVNRFIFFLMFFIDSPLEQFYIFDIIYLVFGGYGLELSIFNNILINVYLSVLLLLLLMIVSCGNVVGSNVFMVFWESLYFLIFDMVNSEIGEEGGRYFPLIISIFLLILFLNLLGGIPGIYATTSQIVYTMGFSFTILFGVTIISISRFGIDFFFLFCPSGTPFLLSPLLILIEGVSYMARGISLGLRLGANIMAGHMLLVILGGFLVDIFSGGFFLFYLGIIPFFLFVAINVLEYSICVIQAYVFVILTCSYIRDSLVLH